MNGSQIQRKEMNRDGARIFVAEILKDNVVSVKEIGDRTIITKSLQTQKS